MSGHRLTSVLLLAVLVTGGCAHPGGVAAEAPVVGQRAFSPLTLDGGGEVTTPAGDRVRYIRRGQGPGHPAVLVVGGLDLIEPLGRVIADLRGLAEEGDAEA